MSRTKCVAGLHLRGGLAYTPGVAKKMILLDPVKLGRAGGKQRAKNLTAEERSESARAAAKARWADKPKKPKK